MLSLAGETGFSGVFSCVWWQITAETYNNKKQNTHRRVRVRVVWVCVL